MDVNTISIILGILGIAIVGYFIWKYFKKPSFPPSQYNSNNSMDSSINTTLPKGNKIVSPQGISSLVLTEQGDLVVMLGNSIIIDVKTNVAPVGNSLKLGTDGSLSVYTANNDVKWTTGPLTTTSANFILTISDTGIVTILNYDTNAPVTVVFKPYVPPLNVYPPPPYNAQNSLDSKLNTTLVSNQSIKSQDGSATLVMQNDGNLVMYTNNMNKVKYSSASNFIPKGVMAQMKNNGALVVKDNTGLEIWTTGVLGTSTYILYISNDGELNVLDYVTGKSQPIQFPSFPPPQYTSGAYSRDSIKWTTLASGGMITSPSGKATLVMQTDGNLVSYIGGKCSGSGCVGGTVVSYTGTYGGNNGGNTLLLKPDGSLNVIPKTGGTPVWSSPSLRMSRYILTIDDSGILYLLDYVSGVTTILKLPSTGAKK